MNTHPPTKFGTVIICPAQPLFLEENPADEQNEFPWRSFVDPEDRYSAIEVAALGWVLGRIETTEAETPEEIGAILVLTHPGGTLALVRNDDTDLPWQALDYSDERYTADEVKRWGGRTGNVVRAV